MKNYHLLSTKVYLLLHYIHNITKLQKHLSIVKIFICMYLASHLHNVSKMNLIIKYVAKFLSKEDSKEDSTKENLKTEDSMKEDSMKEDSMNEDSMKED